MRYDPTSPDPTSRAVPTRPSLPHLVSVLLTLAALPAAVGAQTPALIKNINTRITFSGAAPTRFTSADGRIYFTLGEELWVTDGGAGSRSLCGPAPESCPAVERILGSLGPLVVIRDTEGAIWRSDGSPAGTFRLPTPLLAFTVSATVHPDRRLLFFAAGDEDTGLEPWVTDGTPGGTRRLGDLRPGPEGSSPFFSSAAALGDEIVFSASDGEAGTELWVSNGTPGGTRRLDLRPGPDSSSPAPMGVLGDRVLLSVRDPEENESELWISDGTLAGTHRVRDLTPGRDGVDFRFSATTSDRLFFRATNPEDGQELWVSDGTAAGTRRVSSFDSETPFESGFCCLTSELHPLGNRVVFAANDGPAGYEPWVSDGTPAGTRLLADLCPGECTSRPERFSTVPGRLLFAADDGASGIELWSTDGTAAGTRRVLDLCPGDCDGNPQPVAETPEGLYFIGQEPLEGEELWHTRGTRETTRRLTRFSTSNPFPSGSGAALGTDLVFGAVESGSAGPELWRTDGTPGGTRAYRELPGGSFRDGGSFPHDLAAAGGEVFFFVQGLGLPSFSRSFWRTDGTEAGTRLITALPRPPGSSSQSEPSVLTPVGNRWFFLAGEDKSGSALWTSDGTENGTRVVQENAFPLKVETREGSKLPVLGSQVFFKTLEGLWATDGSPGSTRSVVRVSQIGSSAAVLDDRLFFSARGGGRQELWISDGTLEGTTPLRSPEDALEEPDELTPVAGRVFLVARTRSTIERLWKTDGTSAGTGVIQREDGSPGRPFGLTAMGDRLFFFEDVSFEPSRLWVTDGSVEGTRELAQMDLGRDRPQTAGIGETFFVLEESTEHVLWRSDGTADGTFPVRLLPGDRKLLGLTAVRGRLLLIAEPAGESSVAELWLSDGTGPGTRLLGRFLQRALQGEGLGDFTPLGSRVLFRGTTADTGAELWGFDLPGTGPPPPPPPPPPSPEGAPAAPNHLSGEAVPGFDAILTWRDRSDDETVFVVERRSARSEFERLLTLPANTESATVGLPTSDYPFVFRVRAENALGASDWSNEASVSPRTSLRPCQPSGRQLCLLGGRFRVQVRFVVDGDLREANALPFDFSDDSGTFWFFDPDNIELVVKVLDGRPINQHYWAFYGALSNVEYWVIVTDTENHSNTTYHNTPGDFCGFGDVRAFPRPDPGSASASSSRRAPSAGESRGSVAVSAPDSSGCVGSGTDLCLNASRFRVEVVWSDPRSGTSGRGHAITSTDDSGFFWFFDPENVELVAKLLDARTVNGNFWFFYGGLSDVEYTLTVTDTATGTQKIYRNAFGDICGQADVTAFPGD